MPRVIYEGHGKCLMADYNGRRYCFDKGKPIDIPQEVYDYILLSEHVDAMDLRIIPDADESKPQNVDPVIESPKPVADKKSGRPKGKHK